MEVASERQRGAHASMQPGPARTAAARGCIGAALVAALLLAAPTMAVAQARHAAAPAPGAMTSAPLPPQRRTGAKAPEGLRPTMPERSAGTAPAGSAAARTGARSSPAAAVAPANPAVVSSDDDAPINLGTPAERRARVRRCAKEWAQMKWSGAAAGMIWRNFARQCFAR